MVGMAKVKINSTDHQEFSAAAELAGTTVDQWLAEAGRAQVYRDSHDASRSPLPGRDPLHEVWNATLRDLAVDVRSPQHLSYLMLTRLHTVVNDTALLTAPDGFTRDVIESRLRAPITAALNKQLGRPVHVAVTLAVKP
jgi:hypothetical protein